MPKKDNDIILQTKTLRKVFHKKGSFITAVDGVDLYLKNGETLGLIGESGSGKTTIGRTIMRLHKPTSGQILIDGVDVAAKKLDKEDNKLLRESVQMIFQDPYSSLNEQKNIMNIVAEPIKTLKLDKRYLKAIYENENDVRKYYKIILKDKYWELILAFRLKANKVALKFYDEILDNLKKIKLDKPYKKQNFDYLISEFYNVKFAANEVLSNDVLSIPGKLFAEWSKAQAKIASGKLYSKQEKDLFKAEKAFRIAEENTIGSQRYKKATIQFDKATETYDRFVKLFKEVTLIDKKNINSIISEYGTAAKVISTTALKSDTYKYYNVRRIDSAIAHMLHSTAKHIKKHSKFITEDVIYQFTNSFGLINVALTDLYKKASEHNGKFKVSLKEIKAMPKIAEILEELISTNVKNIEEANDIVFKRFLKENEDVKYKTYDELLEHIETTSQLVKDYKDDEPKQEYLDKFEEAKSNLEKVTDECDEFIQEFVDKHDAEIKEKKAKIDEQLDVLNEKLEDKRKLSRKLFEEKLKEIEEMEIPFFENEFLKQTDKEYKKVVKKVIKASELTNNVVEREIQRTLDEAKLIKKFIVDGNASSSKLRNLIIRNKVFDALNDSGLTKAHAYRYPHEFSGGMRQRVGIARAIIAQPRIIIADEPIAALDLSIQAQIVNMLKKLQKEKDMSMIFIAHDLSMVKYISDRLAIIHLGRIVETGTPKEIFESPIHPYTKNLISSMPDIAQISKGFSKKNFDAEYLDDYKRDTVLNVYDVTKTHKVMASASQFKKWYKK